MMRRLRTVGKQSEREARRLRAPEPDASIGAMLEAAETPTLRGLPLPLAEAARFALATPPGRIRVIVGIGAATLRDLLDEPDTERRRSALFVTLAASEPPATLVERIVDAFAAVALHSWSDWQGGAEAETGTETRAEPSPLPHSAALPEWRRDAAALARAGRSPRVAGCAAEIELAQLAAAISPGGITLVASPVGDTLESPASLVSALEWVARKAGIAIVVPLDRLPAGRSALDRLMFDARYVEDDDPAASRETGAAAAVPSPWLAPVLGRPHPLSEVEKALAAALGRDAELGPLFDFNQIVRTARGSAPRVDLVWRSGRLVVELDGYGDHNTRTAFVRDRHRDYELMLSGYSVLRIANDEIVSDLERSVEKIRDVVRLRRGGEAKDGER